MFLKRIFQQLIYYLFPDRCLVCQEMTREVSSICSICWNLLEFITAPLCDVCGRGLAISGITETIICLGCLKTSKHYDHCRSLLKFNQISRKLVHNFKYHDKTIIAKLVACLLFSRYGDIIAEYDLILPIPMHKLKRIFRFYNQAQLLAEQLAQVSKKEVANDILLKSQLTVSQTTLSRKARLKNVAQSFTVQNVSHLKDKKIILVDDVITTGATVNHCAKVLKKAGASKVLVMSIAIN